MDYVLSINKRQLGVVKYELMHVIVLRLLNRTLGIYVIHQFLEIRYFYGWTGQAGQWE